jgi:anti-sigma factor RsiW
MTNEPTKLDLRIQAYVDGHLDDKTARCLEERMRASPELAERVRDYQEQKEALGLAYGHILDEPVPERLLAVLGTSAPRPVLTLTRAAALVLVIASASLAGWFAGRSHQSEDTLSYDFAERSYNEYVGTGAEPHITSRGLTRAGSLVSDSVSLTVRIPDLSHLGFRLADKETISGGSEAMVRLTYTTSKDESFSLFLHPRTEHIERHIELRNERNVSIAYWAGGPIAAAVVARLPSSETFEIAQEIRAVLSDPNVSKLTIETAPPKANRDLVTGLPSQEVPAMDNSLPATNAPRVPNAIPN